MDADVRWRGPATQRRFRIPPHPSLGKLAAAAAMVFITAYAAIVLTIQAERIAVIWVANALLLAVIVRAPNGWAYLAAGFLGNITANLATGDTLPFAAA